MTALSSLISRVEKATRPSEELDAHIRCALLADDQAYVKQSEYNGAWCVYSGEYNGKPRLVEPQRRRIPHTLWVAEYSSSIDAAVALAERVLPGWDWSAESFGADGAHGRVWKHGWHDDTVVRADHFSPVIALVLATLRALQSKGPEA